MLQKSRIKPQQPQIKLIGIDWSKLPQMKELRTKNNNI
jgi:hypothetical protein